MKPMPVAARHSATCGGVSMMLAPSASSASALPELDEPATVDAVKLIVRPEAVSLSRDSGIPAEIASSVFMGSYQDYVLSAHGQTLLIIDPDPANHETFDAGEKVFLGIAPNKLHIVK